MALAVATITFFSFFTAAFAFAALAFLALFTATGTFSAFLAATGTFSAFLAATGTFSAFLAAAGTFSALLATAFAFTALAFFGFFAAGYTGLVLMYLSVISKNLHLIMYSSPQAHVSNRFPERRLQKSSCLGAVDRRQCRIITLAF
jgi:hypothetical protein